MTNRSPHQWHNLALEFRLSDTYGGREMDPTAPNTPDIDVLLETNLARLACILQNAPIAIIKNTRIERECSVFGRGIPVGQHIARIANQWTVKYGKLLAKHNLKIGLFINAAPRVGEKKRPEPFHIAENGHGLRIVSPEQGIDLIRNDIARLACIPNINSGIWDDGDQHRSRVVHNALVCEKGIRLRERDIGGPDMDDLTTRKVRYCDIDGNLITYFGGEHCEFGRDVTELQARADNSEDRSISITVGDRTLKGFATHGLEDGKEGDIIAYPNGGNPENPNIDIVRKYNTKNRGPEESAYAYFGHPREGETEVTITIPQNK